MVPCYILRVTPVLFNSAQSNNNDTFASLFKDNLKHRDRNMKKILFSAVGLILFLTVTTVQAQKEKYQSLFIYNFSKYVKWPDGQQSGDFVIGVLGTSNITKTLKTMSANKKVNGSKIVVKEFKSASEISGCHILFIAEGMSSKMNQVVTQTSGESILIVSDKPGLAKKGAVINFIEHEGEIKFELNKQFAESRGLKISGSLVSLAILV